VDWCLVLQAGADGGAGAVHTEAGQAAKGEDKAIPLPITIEA